MSSPHVTFRDREDAGYKLALRLRGHRSIDPSVVVLAMPRGGVPVAYEIARMLHAPLDICVVRKIGAPQRVELGLGAVAEGGVVHLDDARVRRLGVSESDLALLVEQKMAEVERNVRKLRGGAPPIDVRGRSVILVDDGVATGGTARATIAMLRARGARRITVAVPIGGAEAIARLKSVADEVVCLHAEPSLIAVGLWYADFRQTTDAEVIALLARRRAEEEERQAMCG